MAIRSSQTRISKSLNGLDLSGLRVRLFDAENQLVGYLASHLATILQGKDKPTYHPSREAGDVCVVTNASKVKLTERKWHTKLYRWHTGYPGGLRERSAKETFNRRPEDILWRAVSGMLPKNTLRTKRLRKLLIFTEDHNIKDIDLVKSQLPQSTTDRIDITKGYLAPKERATR